MRSTSALKRTGFPECIYILTERDKIVHWLLCRIFFFIIQSLTTITLYRGSVGTFFLRGSIRLGSLKCIQKLSIRSVIFCFI